MVRRTKFLGFFSVLGVGKIGKQFFNAINGGNYQYKHKLTFPQGHFMKTITHLHDRT